LQTIANDTISGMVFGLLAAGLQSAAYLFSRAFVVARLDATVRLLITSHLLMGGVALVVMGVVWPTTLPQPGRYLPDALGVSGFYLLGQVWLLLTLRTVEASRVVPLLGFKIVILAAITVGVLRQPLSLGQWAAVGMSVAAALALNFSGRSLSVRAGLGLVCICACYSLSDLCIARLVPALGIANRLHGSVLAAAMAYVICGLVSLAILPFVWRRIARGDWVAAAPFAATWLSGMVCLFICFAAIGAVYGNILQSTRGILSVVAGAVLAALGLAHIEQQTSRWMLLRRLVAAVLMVAAIWLFGHVRAAGG
jgi:hypothetical protein